MVPHTGLMREPDTPLRVLRVIGRLNVGGSTIQALYLTKLLEPLGYKTCLVRGVEGPREGNLDDLAMRLGVRPRLVPSLRRELGPHDLRALAVLTGMIRQFRPDIVHTHSAKAGALGRLAAMLAGRRGPPVVVHTFHGHVLTEYFSPTVSAVFTQVERSLARRTTRIIAVSPKVRHDLMRLSVADGTQIEVIPEAMDLSAFLSVADLDRAQARASLGLEVGARVVTLVARLVPVKRVDRFLRVATLLADLPDTQFLIVGDGDLREKLRSTPMAQRLDSSLTWAGMLRDIPTVMRASDVVVLTSDNEGTPVSLIEAQAAGLPVVSTDVGGARIVVLDGETGLLVQRDDEVGLADAIRRLLTDSDMAGRFGQAGQSHVAKHFSVDRLISDIHGLYGRLLASQ